MNNNEIIILITFDALYFDGRKERNLVGYFTNRIRIRIKIKISTTLINTPPNCFYPRKVYTFRGWKQFRFRTNSYENGKQAMDLVYGLLI